MSTTTTSAKSSLFYQQRAALVGEIAAVRFFFSFFSESFSFSFVSSLVLEMLERKKKDEGSFFLLQGFAVVDFPSILPT